MKITILLVDDDELTNLYHEFVLKEVSEVETVFIKDSPLNAIEFLKKSDHPPTLMFIDLNMPELSGWEFLKIYQKLPNHKIASKTIMLSTTKSPIDLERLKEFPIVSSFYTKPLTSEIVKDCLKHLNK